jgi:nitroreductase
LIDLNDSAALRREDEMAEDEKEGSMKLEQAIYGRRAVRDYADKALDEATIRRLIDAAVQAPNAVNEQPWTFTVVRERERLSRISRLAKAHMLATLPPGPHAERFRPRLSDPKFDIFYGAPALVVVSATGEGPWIVEDCAMAAQTLMLAAFAEGLGSCWIGFAQSFLNTPDGKAEIGAPPAWVQVAPIIVGWPKSFPAPVPRRAPEIHWLD